MDTDLSNSQIPVCGDRNRMATICLVLKITSKAIDLTNHILSPSKSTSDRNWLTNESYRDLAESSVRMWYYECDLTHCQCRQRNTSGWHPIHLASLIGNPNLIIEILNKEREVVNAEYNFKTEAITPLMCGAASGLIDVMRLLTGQGANFSSNPIKDLEWAIKGKSPECLIFVAERASISPKEGTIINLVELFTTGVLKNDATGVLEVILGFTKSSVKGRGLSTVQRTVLARKIQVECRGLFFVALEKGFKDVVKLLIKKAKVNPNHEVNGIPSLHYTIRNNTKDDLAAEILDILLNNGTNVNTRDVKGKTALNIAANAGYVKCAFVLIQREAEISVSDLKSLNERVPQFLKIYFDSLISSRGVTSSPSGELVSIDIRFMGVKNKGKMKDERIKIQEDCKELLFLKFVIDDGQEELLMHPVIQTYLYTKWIICRKYFYCSALLYLLLSKFVGKHRLWNFTFPMYFVIRILESLETVTFFAFLSELFRSCDHAFNNDNRNARHNHRGSKWFQIKIYQLVCFTTLITEKFCEEDDYSSTGNESVPLRIGQSFHSDNRSIIWFAMFGTSTLLITRILVLLNALLLGTFKTNAMKHIFECVLIISVFITILPFSSLHNRTYANFQRGIASISILLAWCYSLFHLARYPRLGIYVEMLLKVFKNFATFFLTYTCVLIGYALAFSVVLPKNSDFKTFISRTRKILTWMVGDLEIEIPKKEADLQIVVNILYVSYILTVTVALINLLIGLAVHDIQGLLIKSKLNESIRQVHYLHMMQSMIYSKPMTDFAPLGIRKFFRRSIKLPLNVHIVTVFPNKSDDKRLPQYLKQNALAVAKINIAKENSQ